jgi:hypothetical protein
VTKDDIKGLAQRAVDARKGIFAEKFAADPTPTKCKMCDFETVCPERQAQIASNRRNPKGDNPFAGAASSGTGAFLTLGFGPAGTKVAPTG